MTNDVVSVRYIVDDVDAAIDFYTRTLGFEVHASVAPAFADVRRGGLRLLLSGPTSSGGRTLPDGRTPTPGGWNRIHLVVGDLAAEVERLRGLGVPFRSEIVDRPRRRADRARRSRREPGRAVPACVALTAGYGVPLAPPDDASVTRSPGPSG